MTIHDDELRAALRDLPRVAASEGFTPEVVARLGDSQARTRPRVAWAAALGAAALTTAIAWHGAETRHERRVAERARQLLAEQQELTRELAALRDGAESGPTIPLSVGEDYDLVLALEPWLRAPARDGDNALAADRRPPI